MKGKGTILVPFVVLFLPFFLSQNLPASGQLSVDSEQWSVNNDPPGRDEPQYRMQDTGFMIPDNRASQGNPQSAIRDPQLEEAEFARKTMKLQIPFIANNGQVDDRVAFYADTFGGTVFVTKDGEIVYTLPNNSADVKTQCLASLMHSPKGIRDEVGMLHDHHVSDIMHPASRIVGRDNKSDFQNPKSTSTDSRNLKSGVVIKETLVGGRVQEITGNEKAVTKVSYLKGNDPSQWKSNISTYDVVSLGEVYDGIELKLKAYGNNVEKLFCVKPDANPDQIQISLSGAKSLKINEKGQLEAETELGTVKFTKPIAYQEIDGKRVEVPVEYRIQDVGWVKRSAPNKNGLNQLNGIDGFASLNSSYLLNSAIQNLSSTLIGDPKSVYGFTVASYNRTKDLVIDPLLASTYLAGSDGERGRSLALDTSGNVYVTGVTKSTDFPTTSGAYDTSFNNGNWDTFVSKLDSGLTRLLASTYLGGSGDDSCYSLTIDTSGNVYVTGYTKSTDFPTTSGAYDTSFNGGNWDAFVSKLDSGLTRLLASTYLGGSAHDGCYSPTIDTSGNVYVTGWTTSTDFPTTSGAYNTSTGSGGVFVSKLDGGLARLLASTYLGGSGSDYGQSLVIDTSGNVYVTGYTHSTTFPTTSGAYDTSFNSGGYYDAFVLKLDSGLTSLLASTYLGGSGSDYGKFLTLDASGHVYVTGYTASTDFPTTSGAYDTSFNGGNWDAFVSKLDSGLTSLLASTYLGGSGDDCCYSLTLDTSENVYVSGSTKSTDFPTTSGAYNTSVNGGNWDVFVSKLNSGLTSLLTSTYLGGSGVDYSYSLALNTSGNVYVTGETWSKDFPTATGAYDTSFNGGSYDTFLSKLDSNLSSSTPTGSIIINSNATYTNSPNVTLSLSVTDYLGLTGYYLSTSTSTPSASDTGWTSVSSTNSYSTNVSYTLHSGDGKKTVYLWFKDNAGNVSSSFSDSITLDTIAPAITITSPTSNTTYTVTNSVIAVGGNASDSTSGISSVTWSNNKGGNGTAKGTTSWQTSSLSLILGENSITITATDGAGNTGTDTIAVTFSTSTVSTPTPPLSPSPTTILTPTPQVSPSQSKEGIVFGYVTNIKGRPIESVRLMLKGVKTKVIKNVSSDANGFFEYNDLEADAYTVIAKKTKYRNTQQKMKLGDGESKEIEIVMKKTTQRR